MTSVTVLENKIAFIRRHIAFAQAYKKYSRPEIEKNDEIRPALERVLYFIVQATIDLGEALIAYRKLPKPADQGDIFTILRENNIIDRSLEDRLIAMAGFRNIIAHVYEHTNYDQVYGVLHKDLKDIEEFIALAGSIK